MELTSLVPLPVVLPLVGAGVTIAVGRHTRLQRLVSVVTLTAVLAVGGVLLWAADTGGTLVVQAGGWPVPLGISLVVDRLAALMLVVSAAVTLAVLLFAVGQGRAGSHDGGDEHGGDGHLGTGGNDEQDSEDAPLPIFHPTLLVLSAGVNTTFVAGDLFNLYVGFEILLFASFVLLTLGGSAERVRAGSSYVVVNLLSSVVFLVGIALVYAACGTVNLALLAGRLDSLPDDVRLVLQLVLLVGFCVKAAVFPMSGWLPDSYPTAPAPVTAVFAGLLTKVGVYAVIRTQTLLFGDGRVNTLLMWAALLTMVVGILGAVAQDDIKRLLSFTLVSHIGYMVFGIALGTAAGLSAAIFYVAHHITVQTTLFLATGLVERRGGSTSLARLGGLAAASPVLGVLFFVPAMNLAGIPPFSGFLGKAGLLQAGVDDGTPLALLLVVGSVLTSLLTLYAVARVWSQAFWRSAADGPATATATATAAAATDSSASSSPGPAGVTTLAETKRETGPRRPLPLGMLLPTGALVAAGTAISLVAGPLFTVTDRAAEDLLERSPYVDAVLDAPGALLDDDAEAPLRPRDGSAP